ncbi:hypothetical protein OROHE_019039 [Orobanche hederae]
MLSVAVPEEELEYHEVNGASAPIDLTSLWISFGERNRGRDQLKGSCPISLWISFDERNRGRDQIKYLWISFEEFPYYLSQTAKNVLVATSYIHLKCKNWASFLTDRLPRMPPRILLSGPGGSEIYQETLTRALAKFFGVRLLIVDSITLPGRPITEDVDSVKESSKSLDVCNIAAFPVFPSNQPKQKADTSKNSTFRKGDRVMFVASSVSGSSNSQNPISHLEYIFGVVEPRILKARASGFQRPLAPRASDSYAPKAMYLCMLKQVSQAREPTNISQHVDISSLYATEVVKFINQTYNKNYEVVKPGFVTRVILTKECSLFHLNFKAKETYPNAPVKLFFAELTTINGVYSFKHCLELGQCSIKSGNLTGDKTNGCYYCHDFNKVRHPTDGGFVRGGDSVYKPEEEFLC